MVVFPNCKINLGLHITGKRADGYHELETIFYPVQLKDVLETVSTDGEMVFTTSGMDIPGNTDNNLCIKAYQLLKKDFPRLPAIRMHLHKIIPMGAGLGGGSADGAFALTLLNDQFNLNLSTDQLIQYAAMLGSDCPFFIINQPCFAEGRGEILSPVSLNLSGYQFVLVHPGIHISTKWAFEQLTPAKSPVPLTHIIAQPIESWKDLLYNDFEAPIARMHPQISSIKNALYEDGAVYASMSGSGSTIFGIYPNNQPVTVQSNLLHPVQIV